MQGDADERNIRYHFSRARARHVSIHYNYIREVEEKDERDRVGKDVRRESKRDERQAGRGEFGGKRREQEKSRRGKRLIARNSRSCCS